MLSFLASFLWEATTPHVSRRGVAEDRRPAADTPDTTACQNRGPGESIQTGREKEKEGAWQTSEPRSATSPRPATSLSASSFDTVLAVSFLYEVRNECAPRNRDLGKQTHAGLDYVGEIGGIRREGGTRTKVPFAWRWTPCAAPRGRQGTDQAPLPTLGVLGRSWRGCLRGSEPRVFGQKVPPFTVFRREFFFPSPGVCGGGFMVYRCS